MIKNLKRIPWVSILVVCAIVMSLFLHVYAVQKPCLNEDEVAQGYNAYSVLQTGYDEYGNLPIRFLSFGENKLPIVGMLSAPFIALLGLNQLSVRLPVLLVGIFFPLLFFGATLALTKSRTIAIIAALLASTNVWLQTTSRHQHEAVVLAAVVLVYLRTLYGSVATLNRKGVLKLGALLLMGFLTYHSAKVVMPFLALMTIITIWKERKSLLTYTIVVLGLSACLFIVTEVAQPNNRVTTLSYFTSPVFVHEIQEGRRLGGSRLYYNKVVYGVSKGVERMVSYVSPQFLLLGSDENPRFGSPQVALLTYTEYILILLGMAWVWVTRNKLRFLLTGLLLASIVPAALALPTHSSTRSYTVVVPLILLASLAGNQLLQTLFKDKLLPRIFGGVLLSCLGVLQIWGISNGWINYFNVYLKNPQTVRSWQCGTTEMADYVWKHYHDFNRFVITRAYGQPYIYLLFSKPYPPQLYQSLPKSRSYNQYGFWEQDGFDKFLFTDKVIVDATEKTAFIMTPEEVKMNLLDPSSLMSITSCGQVRFYVKSNK